MVSLCPQITWRGKQRAINDRTYIVHCTEHTEKMIFARIQLIWYLHDWHFGERDKFLWLELQEVKFFPLQSVWIAEINLFFWIRRNNWESHVEIVCMIQAWFMMESSENAHVDRRNETKRALWKEESKRKERTKTTRREKKERILTVTRWQNVEKFEVLKLDQMKSI